MNRAFAESPDYAFRRSAAAGQHPCAHSVTGANGLVTVTFVHNRDAEGRCYRCHGIMPLTFWQFTNKLPTDMQPS